LKVYNINHSTQILLNRFNRYKAYEVLIDNNFAFNPEGHMDWLLGDWIFLSDKEIDFKDNKLDLLPPYIYGNPGDIPLIKEIWPLKTIEGKLILPICINTCEKEFLNKVYNKFKEILENNNINYNFYKCWYLPTIENIKFKNNVLLKYVNESSKKIKTIKKIKI
jgi:hypothetical protein